MELKQLKYLIAISDEGSFAKAAEVLNISRPALSLSIAKLERELGVALLHRGRYGASATPSGETVLTRARIACSELSLAALEVENSRGLMHSNVTIGVNPRFAEKVIPEAILDLNQFKPHVMVTVICGASQELFALVRSGKADFAVCNPTKEEVLGESELTHDFLFETHDVLCVREGHPLAKLRKSPTKRELLSYPWVVSVRCNVLRNKIFRMLAQTNNRKLPVIVRADATPIIRELVRLGDFIGVTSPGLEPIGAAGGGIVPIHVDGFAVKRRVSITQRAGSPPTIAARDLVGLVRQRLRTAEQKEAKRELAGCNVSLAYAKPRRAKLTSLRSAH